MEIFCFEKAIIVPCVQNGTEYTAGLYLNTGEYVKYSGKRYYGTCDYAYEQVMLPIDNLDISYDKRTVLYFGYTRNHWGHLLIDEVQRLWPIISNENQFDNIVIYTPDNCPPKQFVYSLLKSLGICKSKIIQATCITQFAKVYYAEIPYVVGSEMKDEFFQIFRRASSLCDSGTKSMVNLNQRIYLSRSKLNPGKSWEFGEKGVEKILRKNGYNILYPEKMSVQDQIS